MRTNEHWMQEAIAQAKTCQNDVPVGSIVVFDGKIIGRGANQRELNHDPSSHAEIVAMRQAATALSSWRLDGASIYITLEPCPMCAEAIIQARIKTIVFGAYDLIYGATGSAFNLFIPQRTFPLPEVIGGVAEQECKALLQTFFQKLRTKSK